MELLTPEGADVLAYYDHPEWGSYAAVTENRYGRGTAIYVGCLPHGDLIKTLVRRLGGEALCSRQSAQGFPLVVRGGLNPAGERVRYCLNFSGEQQAVTGVTGRDLLTGHDVGGNWDLPPWGVAIVVSQP